MLSEEDIIEAPLTMMLGEGNFRLNQDSKEFQVLPRSNIRR